MVAAAAVVVAAAAHAGRNRWDESEGIPVSPLMAAWPCWSIF